jgi:hypothetical protein
VPNPNGRNGGPEHQAEVTRLFTDISGRGLRPSKEYYVSTPEGAKNYRFIDVVAIDGRGRVVESYQVGKQTQRGRPISRAATAIRDIAAAKPELKPVFVPYNRISR